MFYCSMRRDETVQHSAAEAVLKRPRNKVGLDWIHAHYTISHFLAEKYRISQIYPDDSYLNTNVFKSESTLLGRWPSEKAPEQKKTCYYCALVLFLCLFKRSLSQGSLELKAALSHYQTSAIS